MNTDRLAKARAVADEKRARGELVRLNPTEKAAKYPGSRKYAINAMCFDCQGFDADPCYQWRIGNCPAPQCPLFRHRPYQHLEGRPTPTALSGSDRRN